jgi:hypothetical protein
LQNIIRIIKSRRMRWAGHVAHMRANRNAYRVLREREEGKRPIERPRRGWEADSRMDFREIGWAGMDWIHLIQDWDQWRTFVYTVMNLQVP